MNPRNVLKMLGCLTLLSLCLTLGLAVKLGVDYLFQSEEAIIFPNPTNNVGLPNHKVFLPLVSRPEDLPQPVLPTPTIEPTPEPTPAPAPDDKVAESEAPPEPEKVYVDMSLLDAHQLGLVTITIFAPWGEDLVMSYEPVWVNFDSSNLESNCPYWNNKACVEQQGSGLYVLAHSESKEAVAELNWRGLIEGPLYPKPQLFDLATINQHVADLTGTSGELEIATGEFIKIVADFATRTVGFNQIFDLVENNRYAAPDTVKYEWCGLPHPQDGTVSAGVTGSVYTLSIRRR